MSGFLLDPTKLNLQIAEGLIILLPVILGFFIVSSSPKRFNALYKSALLAIQLLLVCLSAFVAYCASTGKPILINYGSWTSFDGVLNSFYLSFNKYIANDFSLYARILGFFRESSEILSEMSRI